jgi:hypothetical protein
MCHDGSSRKSFPRKLIATKFIMMVTYTTVWHQSESLVMQILTARMADAQQLHQDAPLLPEKMPSNAGLTTHQDR